jgi:hypothetical protein
MQKHIKNRNNLLKGQKKENKCSITKFKINNPVQQESQAVMAFTIGKQSTAKR